MPAAGQVHRRAADPPQMRHRAKTTATLIGVATAGITLLGGIAFFSGRAALHEAALSHLEAIANTQVRALSQLMGAYRRTVAQIAGRADLQRALLDYLDAPAVPPARAGDILRAAAVPAQLVRGIELLTLEGRVVAATHPVDPGDPRPSPEVLRRAAEGFELQGVVRRAGQRLAIAGPVSVAGEVRGLVRVEMDPGELFAVVNDHTGLGATGETVLAHRDETGAVVFLTPTRRDPHATSTEPVTPSRTDVAMSLALRGEQGVWSEGIVDHTGEPVVAVTRHLPGPDWGLVATMHIGEIERPIRHLLLALAGGGTLVIVLLGLVSHRLASHLSAPLQEVGEVAARIERGDWDARVTIETDDEFGALGRRINRMAAQLSVTVQKLWADNEARVRSDESSRAEARFRLAVDASPAAMLMVNPRGRLVLANRAAEALFGYTRDELLGLSVEVLIPARHRDDHARYRQQFGQQPRARSMGKGRDLYAVCKDGSEVAVEIGLNPVHTPDGEMVLAAVMDITERKASVRALADKTEALAAANEELEQFAYAASHDLRSPLRGISHLAEWIAEDLGDDVGEEVAGNIERLQARVQRMDNLIQDLLDYSRAGRSDEAAEPTDLAQLVEDICAEFAPAELRVTGVDSLPSVRAARTPLATVLRNLIGNALAHHDRESVHIALGCEAGEEGITLRVEDDGPGIEARFQARVFQMFERLGPTTSDCGSGIGLALVRRLVERAGGRIVLTSPVRDGRGCRFEFTWPESQGVACPAPAPAARLASNDEHGRCRSSANFSGNDRCDPSPEARREPART